MRLATVLFLYVSLCANCCFGDEKEEVLTPQTATHLDSTATGERNEPIQDLIEALKGIEKRLAVLESKLQAPAAAGAPASATPLAQGAPPAVSLGQLFPNRTGPSFLPSPEDAPLRSGAAQPGWAPAPRTALPPSKPRVAQETGSWQQFEIDGKVYYIVPAADVLQSESAHRTPARY